MRACRVGAPKTGRQALKHLRDPAGYQHTTAASQKVPAGGHGQSEKGVPFNPLPPPPPTHPHPLLTMDPKMDPGCAMRLAGESNSATLPSLIVKIRSLSMMVLILHRGQGGGQCTHLRPLD